MGQQTQGIWQIHDATVLPLITSKKWHHINSCE